MSHADSPVFDLIPTHCSCCARELTDSTSIEFGIGPVCRNKYGYEDAPEITPEMVTKVKETLLGLSDSGLADRVLNAVVADDSRKAVNVLNYAVAVWAKLGTHEEDTMLCLKAMNQMGFNRLAHKIAKRVAEVTVTIKDDRIHLDTPYRPEFVADVKSISGRKWDGDAKTWSVPVSAKRQVWNLLCKHYEGKKGNGPEGPFEIGK